MEKLTAIPARSGTNGHGLNAFFPIEPGVISGALLCMHTETKRCIHKLKIRPQVETAPSASRLRHPRCDCTNQIVRDGDHCVLLCYRKQLHHQRSNFNAEGLKYPSNCISRQKSMPVPQAVDISAHSFWKGGNSFHPPGCSFDAILNRNLQSLTCACSRRSPNLPMTQ